jgi:hypothetical protein
MSEKKYKEYLKKIKEYKKEVTSSKESANKFLIELGILTPKGNIRKAYKPLCIQKDQD